MNTNRRKKLGVYKLLHQTPIAVYKIYLDITESAAAGMMLSQMMYWFSVSKKRTFYKTNEELQKETGLSNYDIKVGKKIITEKIPFVRSWKAGVPPVTHYKISWVLWEKFLTEWVEDSGGRTHAHSKRADSARLSRRGPPVRTIELTKTTTKRKNTKKVLPKSSTPSLKDHPRWKIWAKKLAKAIAKGQGKEWDGRPVRCADEFRKLHQIEKVSIEDLRDHVLWYCHKASEQNYLFLGRDQYVPVCGNGFTFRKKWDSLQGAKAKDQNWEYHKPTKKRKFKVGKIVKHKKGHLTSEW